MAEEKTDKKPYGFIIYRGDYRDDAQWDRFMAYLKHQTRQGLEDDGIPELYDRMDWKVIVKPLDTSRPFHCDRANNGVAIVFT